MGKGQSLKVNGAQDFGSVAGGTTDWGPGVLGGGVDRVLSAGATRQLGLQGLMGSVTWEKKKEPCQSPQPQNN